MLENELKKMQGKLSEVSVFLPYEVISSLGGWVSAVGAFTGRVSICLRDGDKEEARFRQSAE